MRHEELYLKDIIISCRHINSFLADIEQSEFLENELYQSAILQKFIVIGEAAARISKEIRHQYPEVVWPDIIGFRNIAVHAYYSVQWDIVWSTAQMDLPILEEQITDILQQEYPNESLLD